METAFVFVFELKSELYLFDCLIKRVVDFFYLLININSCQKWISSNFQKNLLVTNN